MNKGWIGVDLDGTLARYDGWKGPTVIGEPIDRMVRKVRSALASGSQVKIFTARAGDQESIPAIKAWCKKHLGQELPITDRKDRDMVVSWDDRCRHFETNTGRLIG